MNRDEIISTLTQIKDLADECIEAVSGSPKPKRVTKLSHHPAPAQKALSIDFDVNERAFVKSHGRGLSGARKFVLLVAYLAKGKVGVDVQLEDVRNIWNRMKSLVGTPFNTFHSNTAKDNGWVNTKKKGVYVLSKSWQEALKK